MKKILIAASVTLLAILIAPAMTGKALQEGHAAELERVSSNNPNLNISVTDIDSGWFSSGYQYRVSFLIPGDSQLTAVDVSARHFHGPLSVGAIASGEMPKLGLSSYTWRSDTFAQLAEAIADSDPQAAEFLRYLPDVAGHGVVSFSGATSGQVLIPEFVIENDGGSVSSSDIVVDISTTAAGEVASAAVTLDHLRGQVVDLNAPLLFELDDLSVDFVAITSLAGMPIGDGEIHLGKLSINTAELELGVYGINSVSTVDLSSGLLGYESDISLQSLNYNDLDIGQSSAVTHYNGLHLPTVRELQAINARFAPPVGATKEQTNALLIQQGEASQAAMLDLLLHKPSIETHWDVSVFEEHGKLDLTLNLDSLSDDQANTLRLNPASGLLQISRFVTGQLQLALPPQIVDNAATYIVEAQAADPMSQPMTPEQKQQAAQIISQVPVTMGYLVDNNGILTGNLALENGETTLNGQPFPLFQLISKYANP